MRAIKFHVVFEKLVHLKPRDFRANYKHGQITQALFRTSVTRHVGQTRYDQVRRFRKSSRDIAQFVKDDDSFAILPIVSAGQNISKGRLLIEVHDNFVTFLRQRVKLLV